ncbi:MAG: hypothetical protein GY846_10030 [Deltaproteobacteria bacterium]|nr:hypothetical protein [Deltaproteobacteria bacterium]
MRLKELIRFVLLVAVITFSGCTASIFESDIAENSAKPWSDKTLDENSEGMVFAVFGDRTGLHYPGKMPPAVEQINRSSPDFVVSVGDHIEGYTRDVEVLNQQWAEFDALIGGLDARFFKVPGNHDYANHVMAEHYKNRHGRDYYYFVFKDILFLCLNTQDPPREKSEDREKKMSNWMQSMVELVKNDPRKGIDSVQKTLKNYSGSHGHAAIFDTQVEYFKGVIDRHNHVKWTFVFMHMPAWDEVYECQNFKKIQQALKGRSYTVFAGHEHQYRFETIDGNAYYRLGPTAAIPRENIPECERQFLMVDFKGAMPTVSAVRVGE